MIGIIWNNTPLVPDKKELLAVRVTDQDLVIADIRNKLANNLNTLEFSIPDTAYILEHQWFLPGCEDADKFIQYIKTIPGLKRDYLEAVSAVIAFNTKKIAWADTTTDWTLSNIIKPRNYVLWWTSYQNYEKYIQACASFLYDRYDFTVKIVGTFGWLERESRHKVNTPYGTFTAWNWNQEIASSGSKVGDIKIEDPWFMIWERMRDRTENKSCVVIDAGHNHNYTNEWTKRIVVLYDDWTTEKKVPRSLERKPSRDNQNKLEM